MRAGRGRTVRRVRSTTEDIRELRRGITAHLDRFRESGLRVVGPPATASDAAVVSPPPPPASFWRPEGELDLFAPATDESRPLTLEQIREEMGECTRCRLHKGRARIVFGEGNPRAEIVFIGEGPGEEEDRQGRPFVGRAGQLLTKIIEEGMKLRREDVYIANIVKCRPPGNREPERDEIAACSPFLLKQIGAIQPKVIVALGRPATSTLLGRSVQITRVRGTWHDFHGIPLMPTYHPAFVLRQYTEKTRREVWEDMKRVLEKIGRSSPPGDATGR
jgi:uracil-DNA glycosylase family 4